MFLPFKTVNYFEHHFHNVFMLALIIALASLVLFVVAYHTYGRWLARRIFKLSSVAIVPSEALRDDVDYVPTAREVVFGHHFTSIAGTGPIVGPALAIMWGWVPALLWVLFGAIFIGAMHDMATLVVSLRNRGMTIGEIAGRVLNPRVRMLFLVLLLFALWVVLAIFGWVIASVFTQFPESILPVFLQIPIAVGIGMKIHRRGGKLFVPSILALGLMFSTVWLGAGCPGVAWAGGALGEMIRGINDSLAAWPVWVWVGVLLLYCYAASVLPVWMLLQPRDYINSLQLIVSLGLVFVGLFITAVAGFPFAPGHPSMALEISAPALNAAPLNAPPIFPFLFVTVACGAISGFHCLVSSGTSSKQLRKETDALFVGYGSMLLEGFLAVLVILSVAAGIGLGWPERFPDIRGAELWGRLYADWKEITGGKAIGAFVVGASNFLQTLGIESTMGRALMGVLVASFAGTTLDTATRLQRYVVQELAGALLGRRENLADRSTDSCGGSNEQRRVNWNPVRSLTKIHGATLFAVGSAFLLAIFPAPGKPWSWETIGTGGLILWPLFGATNQLLGGLALLVVCFWLLRRGLPVWFAMLPMLFMLAMPTWALATDITRWMAGGSSLLVCVGFLMLALTVWMCVEAVLLWRRAHALQIEPEESHGGNDSR